VDKEALEKGLTGRVNVFIVGDGTAGMVSGREIEDRDMGKLTRVSCNPAEARKMVDSYEEEVRLSPLMTVKSFQEKMAARFEGGAGMASLFGIKVCFHKTQEGSGEGTKVYWDVAGITAGTSDEDEQIFCDLLLAAQQTYKGEDGIEHKGFEALYAYQRDRIYGKKSAMPKMPSIPGMSRDEIEKLFGGDRPDPIKDRLLSDPVIKALMAHQVKGEGLIISSDKGGYIKIGDEVIPVKGLKNSLENAGFYGVIPSEVVYEGKDNIDAESERAYEFYRRESSVRGRLWMKWVQFKRGLKMMFTVETIDSTLKKLKIKKFIAPPPKEKFSKNVLVLAYLPNSDELIDKIKGLASGKVVKTLTERDLSTLRGKIESLFVGNNAVSFTNEELESIFAAILAKSGDKELLDFLKGMTAKAGASSTWLPAEMTDSLSGKDITARDLLYSMAKALSVHSLKKKLAILDELKNVPADANAGRVRRAFSAKVRKACGVKATVLFNLARAYGQPLDKIAPELAVLHSSLGNDAIARKYAYYKEEIESYGPGRLAGACMGAAGGLAAAGVIALFFGALTSWLLVGAIGVFAFSAIGGWVFGKRNSPRTAGEVRSFRNSAIGGAVGFVAGSVIWFGLVSALTVGGGTVTIFGFAVAIPALIGLAVVGVSMIIGTLLGGLWGIGKPVLGKNSANFMTGLAASAIGGVVGGVVFICISSGVLALSVASAVFTVGALIGAVMATIKYRAWGIAAGGVIGIGIGVMVAFLAPLVAAGASWGVLIGLAATLFSKFIVLPAVVVAAGTLVYSLVNKIMSVKKDLTVRQLWITAGSTLGGIVGAVLLTLAFPHITVLMAAISPLVLTITMVSIVAIGTVVGIFSFKAHLKTDVRNLDDNVKLALMKHSLKTGDIGAAEKYLNAIPDGALKDEAVALRDEYMV
ncbi:MAG: MFS transporter, partial [Candidatus Omnitrophica bacterium]|nr:MFS transporter [Candidatus Omnitrophota bacterium]